MMRHKKALWSRRVFVVSTVTLPLLGACAATGAIPEKGLTLQHAAKKLNTIERNSGGRIGVAARNLASGETLLHKEHERFAMCSTFKWLLVAAILRRADSGEEELSRALRWQKSELVAWSPVTGPLIERAGNGTASLSVGELCREMLRTSDNTAANVLLRTLGGPRGLTDTLRLLGDSVTRLDRWEPELNENQPGDPRDTSTPEAMLKLMENLLYGSDLTPGAQHTLKKWMVANETGTTRLRAGLPGHWTIGDRSGTSSHDANNNVAFAEAPNSNAPPGPLLLVSFTHAPNPFADESNERHAEIARTVFQALV